MKEYTLTIPENYNPPPLPGRDEWIATLRSGQYTQAKGKLQHGNSHCCLGVLCKLQGRLNHGHDGPVEDDCNRWLHSDNPLFEKIHKEGSLPEGVQINISNQRVFLLSSSNDAGLSFTQIADIIEQVWSDGGPLPKE